jgi:DNA-binding MarR family transcriptional regulator
VGYRLRLDAELAAAGFADQSLPDGRVLQVCARSGEVTIAHIGRELKISRQGAGKIVASLKDRGYLTLSPSPHSGREKVVRLTDRAHAYLSARRQAARRIERYVVEEAGPAALDVLYSVTEVLARPGQPTLSDYLRKARDLDDLKYVE